MADEETPQTEQTTDTPAEDVSGPAASPNPDEATIAGDPPAGTETDAEDIAARTTDTLAAEASEYVKDFVVRPDQVDLTERSEFDEANKGFVRQELVGKGLRATGPVRRKNTRDYGDGVSKIVTYTVPVVVASDVAPE